MKERRIISGIFAAVITLGLLSSPAFAHRRVFNSPGGKLPPRVIAHSHDQEALQQANGDKTNLLEGAADLVGGVFKAVGGTIRAIFNFPAAGEKQAMTPAPPSTENRTGFRFGFPGQK